MTDREMLELAAKAAGICFVENDNEQFGYYSEWRGLPQWENWNPRTDDGDALRLAVVLHMKVQTCDSRACVRAGKFYEIARIVGLDEASDLCDAARLAIVRTAAQIQINREPK